jgi:hypothetical protein
VEVEVEVGNGNGEWLTAVLEDVSLGQARQGNVQRNFVKQQSLNKLINMLD